MDGPAARQDEGLREGQPERASTEQPDVDVSPIPPVFWWSLFVPTFAVTVYAMQRVFARLGSGA